MEPKTGKKIVSKGAYAANLSKKMIASSLGVALLLLGVVGFALALVLLLLLGSYTRNTVPVVKTILGLCVVATTAAVCGYKSFKRTSLIDPGVPLTRANTADLPVPDTLVRASEQPLQTQEAVLLRAAAEGMETPPEQLVRASV